MNNYGWDVVFACSGAHINKQLVANADKCIQAFKYEDSAIEVSGTFGSWEILPGGSPKLLQFQIPITKGSCTIKSVNKIYSLDGAVPVLQLQLDFIDGPGGKSKDLQLNCKVLGKKIGDTTPGAVTVINPDSAGILEKQDPDGYEIAGALLATALGNTLIENKDELAFVFASVLSAAPKNAGWLNLQEFAYVYQQEEDGKLGNFAILGMLTACDISTKSHVFDTSLLRPGDDVGFELSGTQFLKNIILPKLPEAYLGSNPSQFTMSGNTIVNNGNVTLNEVKVGLIWYPPCINDLSISIQDTSILTIASGSCNITGLDDAYVTFAVSANNEAEYGSGGSIIFEPSSNKHISTGKHIPWWESLLGVMTAGLLNLIVELISNAIESSVADAVSRTGVSAESMGAAMVSWPGEGNLNFDNGGLVDNFFMRGKAN